MGALRHRFRRHLQLRLALRAAGRHLRAVRLRHSGVDAVQRGERYRRLPVLHGRIAGWLLERHLGRAAQLHRVATRLGGVAEQPETDLRAQHHRVRRYLPAHQSQPDRYRHPSDAQAQLRDRRRAGQRHPAESAGPDHRRPGERQHACWRSAQAQWRHPGLQPASGEHSAGDRGRAGRGRSDHHRRPVRAVA
ncbi:hypothetical protein D3C81_1142940 [compost metagenome]